MVDRVDMHCTGLHYTDLGTQAPHLWENNENPQSHDCFSVNIYCQLRARLAPKPFIVTLRDLLITTQIPVITRQVGRRRPRMYSPRQPYSTAIFKDGNAKELGNFFNRKLQCSLHDQRNT